MAELPRPICPFWAAACGRNLSGFGGITGFTIFFRFTHRGDAPRHETLANFLAFIYQCVRMHMHTTLEIAEFNDPAARNVSQRFVRSSILILRALQTRNDT